MGELRYVPLPLWVDDDHKFAILAYTHDLRMDRKAGNLYYELNSHLRQRIFSSREDTRESWGIFMHHMMKGLSLLDAWEGDCYRGYPDRAQVMAEFQLGSQI